MFEERSTSSSLSVSDIHTIFQSPSQSVQCLNDYLEVSNNASTNSNDTDDILEKYKEFSSIPVEKYPLSIKSHFTRSVKIISIRIFNVYNIN